MMLPLLHEGGLRFSSGQKIHANKKLARAGLPQKCGVSAKIAPVRHILS